MCSVRNEYGVSSKFYSIAYEEFIYTFNCLLVNGCLDVGEYLKVLCCRRINVIDLLVIKYAFSFKTNLIVIKPNLNCNKFENGKLVVYIYVIIMYSQHHNFEFVCLTFEAVPFSSGLFLHNSISLLPIIQLACSVYVVVHRV